MLDVLREFRVDYRQNHRMNLGAHQAEHRQARQMVLDAHRAVDEIIEELVPNSCGLCLQGSKQVFFDDVWHHPSGDGSTYLPCKGDQAFRTACTATSTGLIDDMFDGLRGNDGKE